MRVWQLNSMSQLARPDMVREQDFILRLRRLQRMAQPHTVVNFALDPFHHQANSFALMNKAEAVLHDLAKRTNAQIYDMSNGDYFLIWEDTADADLLLAEGRETLASLLPQGHRAGGKLGELSCSAFRIPQDYTALRERVNHYLDLVRAKGTFISMKPPADLLRNTAPNGPLTAWGVDQISQLFPDLDIRNYAHSQTIYTHQPDGNFAAYASEFFVSIDDLKREFFPQIDVITPEHLFLALCEGLDQKLITALLDDPSACGTGNKLHLNISVATLLSPLFSRFARQVARADHANITFELHRGDVLQDFTKTLNALSLLRNEGFGIALDGLTPELLPFLHLPAFKVDRFKINVMQAKLEQAGKEAVKTAIAKLDPTSVIFYRCDSQMAIDWGREMGISHYQGWFIDDLLREEP